MTLYIELTTDPNNLGYTVLITDRNDQAIHDLINLPRYTVNGIIPANVFAIWSGATGMRALIQDHANNVSSPVRNSALLLLDLLTGNLDKTLDLSNSGVVAMMQSWVTANILSQADANALLALSQTQISRAQQLGISATLYEISHTLNTGGL